MEMMADWGGTDIASVVQEDVSEKMVSGLVGEPECRQREGRGCTNRFQPKGSGRGVHPSEGGSHDGIDGGRPLQRHVSWGNLIGEAVDVGTLSTAWSLGTESRGISSGDIDPTDDPGSGPGEARVCPLTVSYVPGGAAWGAGLALRLPLSTAPWASLPPGTSLLQEVVYLVSQGADPDEIGLMNIDEQLPVLEYPQPGLDIIKELTSPRLIKSHLPYRFLPSDLHNGDSKVIYMARNPKDLVVSYYQFHRSLRTMSYRGTFQEFCRRFMNDKLGYGSWFEHVQEFWEHRMDSNVLFLKYEDMHRDLVTMVEQLARFLGVSCDKAQLEALSEHCHQLVDQCCNAEALPVGRGRVGLWKDIFTVSMNEKFDLVYKQKMGKCDLTFDFYL
ncbi:sulfotransferase 4A1 [Puma concolor]|uniref:Sulfotransferase n=1 Tax=Puma concolor TaxID=9696 RepID=A0A6P6I2I5_PUMCO|nr:sulfotransferase 4A1 [Puma concolor]